MHRVRERCILVFSDSTPPLHEEVMHRVNVQSVKEEEEEIDGSEVYVCDAMLTFGVDSEKEW